MIDKVLQNNLENEKAMVNSTEVFGLTAFPMHGQKKLSTEGYRTRDGHLIEWFGRLLPKGKGVQVVSRPDPFFFKRSYNRERIADNTKPVDTYTFAIPNPKNRKQWWSDSSRFYPFKRVSRSAAYVVWNPFVFLSPRFYELTNGRPVAFDLLDDWTVHHAFTGIRAQVQQAYSRAFRRADTVYANSEGTQKLAVKFGRDDVVLVPNGVDRDRFSTVSRATGPVTVGYVGKIGKRVDLELVMSVASQFSDWQFTFAGPMIDPEYRRPLQKCKNISLLGDVEYSSVPKLLESFDIGWVPHSVGDGEVGGDAIKIYEYNAAGLPVVSTPIIGAGERGIGDVHVVPASGHADMLRSIVGCRERVPRVRPSVPIECSWEYKARLILQGLGIRVPASTPRTPQGDTLG